MGNEKEILKTVSGWVLTKFDTGIEAENHTGFGHAVTVRDKDANTFWIREIRNSELPDSVHSEMKRQHLHHFPEYKPLYT